MPLTAHLHSNLLCGASHCTLTLKPPVWCLSLYTCAQTSRNASHYTLTFKPPVMLLTARLHSNLPQCLSLHAYTQTSRNASHYTLTFKPPAMLLTARLHSTSRVVPLTAHLRSNLPRCLSLHAYIQTSRDASHCTLTLKPPAMPLTARLHSTSRVVPLTAHLHSNLPRCLSLHAYTQTSRDASHCTLTLKPPAMPLTAHLHSNLPCDASHCTLTLKPPM